MKKLLLSLLLAATGPVAAWADIVAPTSVTATALSTSTIKVDWNDNSSDESGFRIYMANSQGAAFVKVGEVAANVETFTAGGLPATSQRYFRVLAFKHSVYVPEDISNVSAHAQATTLGTGPANTAPVAVDDVNSGVAPVTLTGNVLTNDTDANSDPLTVQQPNANIAANGSYSINFTTAGTFPFNYTVLDGRGGSDTGVLTITITAAPAPNNPPVAVDDTYTTQRDVVLTDNVLTNDTDADSDPLTATPITTGPFILAANGDFTFTPPATGTTFGIDYTVLDDAGGEDVGHVTIEITDPNPSNIPPVAEDDFNNGEVNVAITGNVLINDSDEDSDGQLNVVQPAGIINANGFYTFTSSTTGIFNFPYTLDDGDGGRDTANLQITVFVAPPATGLVAFPGADGYGKFARGGRGGAQLFVTNRNDDGPGSYRACVEAIGPRTCIFRVSGDIPLQSTVDATSPFLTVAGETSPNGITLRSVAPNKGDLMVVATHDVIIRHMKFRGGHPPHNTAPTGSPNGRNLMLGDIHDGDPVHDVIVDHMSASWATDQTFDVSFGPTAPGQASPIEKLTVQNSLVYEGLRNHSKGPNYRSCGISTLRSMIASNTIRNPNNTCGKHDPNNLRVGGGITGENEFTNNVVYNGGEAFLDMWSGRGEAWLNIVGNVFKKGPNTRDRLSNNISHDIYPVDAWHQTSRQAPSGTCQQNNNAPGCVSNTQGGDPLHMCVQGNTHIGFNTFMGNLVTPTNPNGTPTAAPPIHGVVNPNDAHLVESTNCVTNPVGENGIASSVLATSSVFSHVMQNAGAFPKHRDSADAKIVADATNGTGSIPLCTSSSTAATCDPLPYPVIPNGTPYPDSDNDGMDDTYESANGVTNPNGDIDNDGYTNLEEFLHQLAATR